MVRIAVVNDDTVFLSLMAELIKDAGWETVILREGDAAYQIIKENRPDAVILDLRLEHPDTGWKVLELIKLDPATRHIPIIVCSAAIDDLRVREDWLDEHGIATLLKPFDIDDLYRCLEIALDRRAPVDIGSIEPLA
ncbi:MAG: hypothetical protein NVS2B16_04980 [Chloroflexota bacterium]